jgi:hypothetical protein
VVSFHAPASSAARAAATAFATSAAFASGTRASRSPVAGSTTSTVDADSACTNSPFT